MFKRLQKLLDRIESRIALWKIITGSGILTAGGISAWVASATKWLDAYGPISWWFAGLIGGLIALLLILLIAWLRYLWIKSQAVRDWNRQVDTINPLEADFQRKRIKLSDLAHPVSKRVAGKRFVDCQLIGPANIVFIGRNHLTNFGFGNCDLVVMNPTHAVPIHNVISFENTQIIGGEILSCTVFIPPSEIPTFKGVGAQFISFTGDPQMERPSAHIFNFIKHIDDNLNAIGIHK